MKAIEKKIPWVSSLLTRVRFTKNTSNFPVNATVFIHIGKCGGRTIKDGIKNAVLNPHLRSIHLKKPLYRSDLKYIIVARNPLSRLNSAFRWRYKIVVTEGNQRDRFKGEYDVLIKYGCLNNLAESLYDENGKANTMAHQELNTIHHCKKGISFYLSDLLKKCHPNQIIDVLMQESLDEDIFRVFGYRNNLKQHIGPQPKESEGLSEHGRKNLMRFLKKDYEVLAQLYCLGKINKAAFIKAIQ